MNKSKHQNKIKLYVMMLIIASCKMPVIELESRTYIPEMPEIEIIEENKMIIKPIEQYGAYTVDEQNRVFGLIGNSIEAIVLKDSDDNIHTFNDFFKIGADIYFSVKETIVNDTDPENITSEEVIHYFSQVDNEVSEFVSASDYPTKPEPKAVTMAESPFQIVKNGEYSEVMRDTLRTGFSQINGYFFTPDGLWFSVTETISIRKKGVYFYPVSHNLPANPVIVGRVW